MPLDPPPHHHGSIFESIHTPWIDASMLQHRKPRRSTLHTSSSAARRDVPARVPTPIREYIAKKCFFRRGTLSAKEPKSVGRRRHLKGWLGTKIPQLWGQKLTSGFEFFFWFCVFLGLGAKNSDLGQYIHLGPFEQLPVLVWLRSGQGPLGPKL